MTELSGSLFVFTVLILVLLGTILAAVGFGYSRGYFYRRTAAPVFCYVCGSRISWMRRTCERCGTAVFNLPNWNGY